MSRNLSSLKNTRILQKKFFTLVLNVETVLVFSTKVLNTPTVAFGVAVVVGFTIGATL